MEGISSRMDFGEEFIFGGSSSAYQHEGAAAEGGRGPSIWDTFTNLCPEKVNDKSNGNVAIDQYNLFKEDVQMIKKIGLDAFRFSISWSRVLPGGRINAGVNVEGIKYYNNLINELIANGIQPFVTLFHWDVPQALEDEYGGFLSRKIVDDFCEYAELCFWEFGDRVKYWITMNEPWSFIYGGYVEGTYPPGRGSSSPEHLKHNIPIHRCHTTNYSSQHKSDAGDPATEPYLAGHYMLLAHAEAVKLYKDQFKVQGGKIGITLVSQWWEPLHNTAEDNEAVERAFEFFFGWFMEPLTSGKYPKSMIDRVGSRLPKFSLKESAKVKGSFDFIGLNYYTAQYVTDDSSSDSVNGAKSYITDRQFKTQVVGPDGKTTIGPKAASCWLYVYPLGFYKLLCRIKTKYNDPLIYITENGVDEVNDPRLTLSEAREDPMRIKYHKDHLSYVKKAMDVEKVNVKGYFIWSVFDNFEWTEGYTVRFGLIHVNYKNSYARYPKKSAIWFMNFLKKKGKDELGMIPKNLSDESGFDVEEIDLSTTTDQDDDEEKERSFLGFLIL